MATSRSDEVALRVIAGGEPTAEELAAFVVALSTRRANPRPPRRSSVWADRTALLRRPLRPGPDSWRRSAAPHA